MKVTEQEICEYLFNLLSPDVRAYVKDAIENDPEVVKEYNRLRNKFDRLKLLEADYPNPLVALSQVLAKHSAIVAVLTLIFSLWFLPNQAHAEERTVSVESHHKIEVIQKVCCTSGISPRKAPKFDKNLNEILASNFQVTSYIDSEMNYSTQYLKKLSLQERH